jgi:hypothetical protein
LVDVGQALADLESDRDAGVGCRFRQTFGIARQQVGSAYLYKQQREIVALGDRGVGARRLVDDTRSSFSFFLGVPVVPSCSPRA